MRQLVAALLLDASMLGLSACSNAGGSGFIPAGTQGVQTKPNSGYPFF